MSAVRGRIEAGSAAVAARAAGVLTMADDGMPTWARAMEERLTLRLDGLATRAELARTRADVMERIDRLQERVDGHAQDIQVNLAAAQIGGDRARAVERDAHQREVDRAREMPGVMDMIHAMQRQIRSLQTEVRELRERRGEG